MDNNKYMIVHPNVYKQIKEFEEHYQKWYVDLFTPKGLSMLFNLKEKNS